MDFYQFRWIYLTGVMFLSVPQSVAGSMDQILSQRYALHAKCSAYGSSRLRQISVFLGMLVAKGTTKRHRIFLGFLETAAANVPQPMPMAAVTALETFPASQHCGVKTAALRKWDAHSCHAHFPEAMLTTVWSLVLGLHLPGHGTLAPASCP